MQESILSFEKSFWIKLVIVICYFILVIGVESIYREELFKISLNVITELQDKNYYNSSKKFFEFISQLGTINCFLPFLAFILIFYPINKAFLILSLIVHSSYWDNLMKIIYGNPRPFWEDTKLDASCNGGFGNPSGHSFSSTAVYLGISLSLVDHEFFKKRNIIFTIILYIFFLALIVLIIYSRVILAAHAINQVLYGGLLGIGVYFIHCHLFNLINPKAKLFFELFKNKLITIIFIIFYAIMLCAITLVYFNINNNSIKYSSLMTLKCPNKENYRMFNPDGLFNALSLFGLIGGHFGLIFLVHYIEKYYPNKQEEIYDWDWNRKSYLYLFIKILFIIISMIPLSLFFIIPGDSDLGIIYTFKVSIPYFVSCFLIFGPCIWLFIYKKYANQKIYVIDISNSEIALKKIDEEFYS